MRRAGLASAAVAVVLATGALAGLAGSGVAGARDTAYGTRIRLARSVFDPTDGPPSVPDRFSVPLARTSLWLVQLRFPVSRATQAALPRTGIHLLGVVPDVTFVARGSVDQAVLARGLKGVRAVVPLQPWFKVAPALDRLQGQQFVQVGTYPDVKAADVAARLRAGGVQVARVDSDRILTVRTDATHLAAVAADEGVAALSPVARMQTMNAIARWTTQSARRAYTPLTDHGLDGTGEAVAVADTGNSYYPDKNGNANWYSSDCTDPAHPTTATCKKADYTYQAPDVSPTPPIGSNPSCNGSSDLMAGPYAHVPTGHRKMVAYFNEVAVCAAVPGDSGSTTHGSHTSGSVAGNRPPYTGTDPYDGQAPQAKLVFQDIGDDTESLAGLPGDLYPLFDQAYNPGLKPTTNRGSSQPAATPAGVPYARGVTPRVHSNSWGSAVPVVSLGNSPRADDFVTNNEDMAIVVAAGNSGPDQASVGEPGTAKDVITSGAMANGDDDFASLDTMANFSSHGEALNAGVLSPVPARIKPDVATPGLRLVSPKGGTDTETQVMQGTSMSTPTLAGDSVLVRQYFEDGFGPGGTQGDVTGFATGTKGASAGFNPSAALVKAVLVSSGQRMRGQYTGTQGSDRTQDGQWPSDGQGWGRVQLDRALHMSDVNGSPDLWVRDREFCPPPAHCDPGAGHGVATNDDNSYTINVAAGQPLKVILAWSDPGGLVSAIGLGPENIVNQLSLQVDGPGGTQKWCANNINTMSSPSADEATSVEDGGCTPLTYDKTNNVQGVYLPHPAAGTYTIHVVGQAVMQDQNAVGVAVPPGVGQQGYALAATGAFTDAPASTATPPAPATPKVTSSSVSAPSSDLAVVRWTTNAPTTGEVTLTDDKGATHTQADVYSRKGSSFQGLDLTQVENDGQFLDKPMLATEHVAKLTGLDPGAHYTVSIRATDATGTVQATAASPSFATPGRVFSPTVASDTATLYSANTTVGPPIPDAAEDTWGISSQFYTGHLPSTAAVACRVAGVPVCPPVDAISAFKVRLPKGFAASDITGAALELFTRHDLTSRVLAVPRHSVDLLTDSAEKQWGPGTTYQQVVNDPVDATVGPSTVYRQVPYDVEAFTFACADLATLVHNLEDGQAAFRVSLSGDLGTATGGQALDEALYSWETGFGRRSSGVEFRPRLILFGPNGDPLGQTATSAPAVSDVRTERVSDNSAVVHWHTDQPSDSIVFVHEDGTQGGIVQVGSPAFVTDHHVQVDGFDRTSAWQFGLRSSTPDGLATTAVNGGKGWLLTQDDPAPPGPAPAGPGSAGFSLAGVTSETLASADAVDAGTGRACDPVTLGEPGPQPVVTPSQTQSNASVQPRRLPSTGLDGRAPLVALALLGLAALLRGRRSAARVASGRRG